MAKRRFKNPACPNCGIQYVEGSKQAHFCPGCGQENHDVNVPLRHLVAEALEGILHFDSKSVRTLRSLALRPGFLTAELVRGRRARYVPPVRLYVFVSFLFFLILALLSGRHDRKEADLARGFFLSYRGIQSNELRNVPDSELEALMRARRMEVTPFNRHVLRQMARISRGGPAELQHLAVRSVSQMMFVLMPVFGLLLFLFFRKNEPHCVASLVFSLHYHSFAFLLLAMLLLLGQVPRLGLAILVAPLVLAVYLPVALRTAYRQSWTGALLKAIAILFLHLVLVILLFVATIFVGILLF